MRKRDLGDSKYGLGGFLLLLGVVLLPKNEASIGYQMAQWVGVRVKVRVRVAPSIRVRVSN